MITFFAVYDSLAENAYYKFPRQICTAFVSDWLEYLIHIHDSKRFAHFRLFVDE